MKAVEAMQKSEVKTQQSSNTPSWVKFLYYWFGWTSGLLVVDNLVELHYVYTFKWNDSNLPHNFHYYPELLEQARPKFHLRFDWRFACLYGFIATTFIFLPLDIVLSILHKI